MTNLAVQCWPFFRPKLSEWVSDSCLTPIQQFFSYLSWREQVNFQWDDAEVGFALHQHAELEFYRASSLKQQSAGRNIALLFQDYFYMFNLGYLSCAILLHICYILNHSFEINTCTCITQIRYSICKKFVYKFVCLFDGV